MAKLPVFRTYGRALGFTLWNAFTIFRLTWLPIAFLVAVVLSPFIALFFPETFRSIHGFGKSAGGVGFGIALTYQLALILLQAIAATSAAVAVHRVILFNDRKPGHYFLFAFGKTEVAFFVMSVLSILIALSVLSGVLAPVIYLVAEGDFAELFSRFVSDGGATLVSVLAAYFVGWVIVIYIFVRLAVWPPSVVATNRVSPAEAWALTRGNFWRFIGLFILGLLTIYAIYVPIVVGLYFSFREDMLGRDVYEATKDLTHQDMMAITFAPYLPTIVAVYFFGIMYVAAFMVALVSFAYKALKGVDAGASIDGG